MRCFICDASDQGLSYYRPDGNVYVKHFHEVVAGFICDDCYEAGEEVISDFNEDDLVEEEQQSAFEYD